MKIPSQIKKKAKLRYAWLHEPCRLTHRYQVDLYDLPEETKKILLMSEFIKDEQYEDPDYKLVVKRNSPAPVTLNNQDFKGMVDNGTEAIVTIQTMLKSFKNKEMFVCTFTNVKITNLITQVQGNISDDEINW